MTNFRVYISAFSKLSNIVNFYCDFGTDSDVDIADLYISTTRLLLSSFRATIGLLQTVPIFTPDV